MVKPGCINVPSHRTKLYGKNSVCISAIFTWNFFQNLHRNISFHKLTSKSLKKLLTLSFLRKYVWKGFSHNIFLAFCWSFILEFLSSAWRGFSRDGIGLHKTFLGVPLRGVEMKIFILTFSLIQHSSRRSIININEFLTTSPRAVPLVLASLCENCSLTLNLFASLIR